MQARSVFETLKKHGINPASYSETKDAQVEDGSVTIDESLYVHVSAFSNDMFLNKWIGNRIASVGYAKNVASLARQIKKELKA